MSEQSKHFYEFGRFRINVAERLLLRDEEVVPLTPKVFEILLALVQNSGHVVSKDEIMRAVWPDTYVEEGNLTQNISILRKALGEGKNGHQYIETIPRRGYRFVAPVQEASGERLNLPQDVQSLDHRIVASGNGAGTVEATSPAIIEKHEEKYLAGSLTGRTINWFGRRGLVVALTLAAVAAAVAVYFIARGKPVESANVIDSIAVLPFANNAADPDTDYFSDKVAESLINNLVQLPKLRVLPRSVVAGYKGREVDPIQIGQELNVRAILTGRVHRRGDTLSIQVDLIDVANKAQVWGQRYDRKISDILLVQEDISRDIFENLRLKINLEEKRQLEAFSLYLKGRNYLNKRTEDGLHQGIKFFQDAIEVDPRYAPAYAGLADCYNMFVVYGLRQPNEAFPLAKDAAQKALSIDDTLAEAHTSLAFIKHRYDWERAEAEREFQLAIKHKPGYAPAHQWYSSYLIALGRDDEAIAEAKRGQELEPLSFISNSHLAWVLYLSGRYDEAIAHCKKLLDVDPNFFPARRYLGLAYEQKGMYQEAIMEFQEGVKLSGSPLMMALLGHAYAIAGKRANAEQVLSELEQQKQRYASPYTIAAIYAGLGEKDEAFKWLEKAYQERDIWLINLKVDPVLSPLRSDKRFADLLRRIGLG